jgi:purine-binding chemotaxis protein CheW
MSDNAEASANVRRQFITFRSGEQEFGADIMMIREIRGWTDTTPLPHSPEFMRGVINLRGTILPVVDLKARLGRGRTEATVKHVIIVVRCAERTMGLLVDAVSDILTVTIEDIQATPDLARDAQSEFIEGIAVFDQRMVTILGMEKLTAALVGDRTGLSQAA